MGTNCTFKVHLHGHIRCTPPIWCTTAIADLDDLSGTLHQRNAKVNADLDCLAKEVLSWSLHSRITFSPFPYCGLWKEATMLGRNGEFCPFPGSNEYAHICFKYSAWLFGFYFPLISVINHLSLALSIRGLFTPLFSFLSWSNFGHWGLFLSYLVFLRHTTPLCSFGLFPPFGFVKHTKLTLQMGFPTCGKWPPGAVYLTVLHSVLQWVSSSIQVKTEHKIRPRVSRAHVPPAGTVPLVPGGTVHEDEGDVEDGQMAGQKNRQKGLQTTSQTSSETKCCRFSLEHWSFAADSSSQLARSICWQAIWGSRFQTHFGGLLG